MNEKPQELQLIQLQSESENGLTIRDILLILIRRLWIIFVVFFFVMTLTILYLMRAEKQYNARAVVRIPASGGSGLSSALGSILSISQSNDINTELELVRNRKIAANVVKQLNIDKRPENIGISENMLITRLQGKYRATRRQQTSLIEVIASSNSPKEAMEIANAVAYEYINVSKESSKRVWENLISQMENKLDDSKNELDKSRQLLHQYESKEGINSAFGSLLLSGGTINSKYNLAEVYQGVAELKSNIIQMEIRLESLRKNLPEANPQIIDLKNQIANANQKLNDEQNKAIEVYNKQFGLSDLAAKVVFYQQVVTTLIAKQEELKAQFIMQFKSPELIEPAIEPQFASKPRKFIVLVVGAFLGGVFGLACVIIVEVTNKKIVSPDYLKRNSKNMVLGKIPKMRGAKDNTNLIVQYNTNQKSWVKELYKESHKAIRTEIASQLNSSNSNSHGKTILITSPSQKEGKSIISANLAISLAETMSKVLLIELDQRHPIQAQIFGKESSIGLIDLILDKSLLDDAITATSRDNLYLLTSGIRDDRYDLSSLLVSDNMNRLIDELKKRFDFIIIDSTPITLSSDSVAIGSKADGVVLIMRLSHTHKSNLQKSEQTLKDNGMKVLGIVANCSGLDRKFRSYYK